MAEELIMPKWGLTMEEGTLVGWRCSVGDQVVEGEVIADVETDKIENELVSPLSGVVTEILVAEEETVAVGTPLALIEAEE